jgi:hypothetical protein
VTKGYPDFLTTHWKHLLFGMLLMAMSGFGRTFFMVVYPDVWKFSLRPGWVRRPTR